MSAQFLAADPVREARTFIATLSDAGGHLVRIRREVAGRSTQALEFHQGILLPDALTAFTLACEEELQRLGGGAHERKQDARGERWLDHWAAAGEWASPGRPRPRRSIPHLPVRPPTLAAPLEGWARQVYPRGARAVLVAPSAGPAVLSIWRSKGERPDEVVSATSRDTASSLLSGAGRLPYGCTLEGILVEEAGSLSFVALDLMLYNGEKLTATPLATRASLLAQLWSELDEAGGVPADWQLASLDAPWRPDAAYTWRVLAATYEAPGAWGFLESSAS